MPLNLLVALILVTVLLCLLVVLILFFVPVCLLVAMIFVKFVNCAEPDFVVKLVSCPGPWLPASKFIGCLS